MDLSFIFDFNAPLNALAWAADSRACAVALGDGHVALVRPGLEKAVPIPVDGTPLCLITTPTGWMVGTDAGDVWHISPDGEATRRARFARQFVEHMVYIPKSGILAVAVGKQLALIPPAGEPRFCAAPCPSPIAGLALSPLGPRVAASHYGGVSIYDAQNPQNLPRVLHWKGSHLAATYSPNGKWLITAMQERAIHLWRLSDALDLHMRGYPGAITQLDWDHTGTRLGSTGGSGVPLWDFSPDKGPAGQQALVLGDSGTAETLVTGIAFHPKGPFCAVGYADGLVLLTNYPDDKAVLLEAPPAAPTGQDAIAPMAFSPDGLLLAYGRADGRLGLVDFTKLA